MITPTRGRPDLLLRTIDCVRRQSFSAWEMIIVDDGDGDGMHAAQQLGDSRLCAYANSGRGQVDARNLALSEARGEIVRLLDDDDRWGDTHHLQRVAQHFNLHAGLLFCGGWLVLEEQQHGLWRERQRFDFDPVTTQETLRINNTILCSGVAYPL